MKRLIESLKKTPWIMKMHWIIFSWKGKRWFLYQLRRVILSTGDLLKAPKQKWTRKEIWRQLFFHRYFRSPESLYKGFRETLRVCATYRCNLKCKYCYAQGLEKEMSTDMSLNDFIQLILWAKDKGWKVIRFLGGEPTVHPNFSEMVDICSRHGMQTTMSTNNVFSAQVRSKFNASRMSYISINYIYNSLDEKQKRIFEDNLKHFSLKKIPFELSYIIDHKNDDYSQIFKHAKMYKAMAIRASIAIPGVAKQSNISEINDHFKKISSKVLDFQQKCIDIRMPFYIYRPLMPCMFSAEEWKKLKGTFPFICFTRCPVGLMGDYSNTVVVNPDLSIFPCIAVFNKGPNIFSFKDRKQISSFYQKKMQPILSKPVMESCENCEKQSRFLSDIEKGSNSDLKTYFSQKLCQGGCLSFKENFCLPCNSE
jgi:MoaA/NifB/PqqE/SkfB family radical SAM enzyme